MSVTKDDLLGISIIERVCSVFSLFGCIFIIVTFCLSRSFHKPINRLVFYASFGNMLCNIGTLMSRSFVHEPASPGCQTQAFLIQMFLPADACWTLAMACNVYLTFYHRFDTRRLRKMEPYYLGLCYGLPFIPAFIFLFVKDGNGAIAYGDARLWCWISTEWNLWRIATFYGPVWLIILITFFIYIRAGRTIYARRKQLLQFGSMDPVSLSRHGVDTNGAKKTTEVAVTTITTTSISDPAAQTPPPRDARSIFLPNISDPSASYTINIFADIRPSTRRAEDPERIRRPIPEKSVRARADNAAWQYTKCSILFFTAMLITWIPSSANRVQSYVHGNSIVPLEYMSAFVLPLQGFWNTVIYMATSWNACRDFWSDVQMGRRPQVTEILGRSDGGDRYTETHGLEQLKSPVKSGRHMDSESTASLARSSGTTPDRQWTNEQT